MVITRDKIVRWLHAYAVTIAAHADELTELDAAIGDGDHGANMDRGFQAVGARLRDVSEEDIGSILKTTGMTLISTVGGASGPLYGTFFLRLAAATAGKSELAPADWAAALRAGVEGVIERGKAQPGDKTMVDALVPAADALDRALAVGADLPDALRLSADAAVAGMKATFPLVARKGRASYLGERSMGHQDPGATSAYLLLTSAAESLV